MSSNAVVTDTLRVNGTIMVYLGDWIHFLSKTKKLYFNTNL